MCIAANSCVSSPSDLLLQVGGVQCAPGRGDPCFTSIQNVLGQKTNLIPRRIIEFASITVVEYMKLQVPLKGSKKISRCISYSSDDGATLRRLL